MPKIKKVVVIKPKVVKTHFFLPKEKQEYEDISKNNALDIGQVSSFQPHAKPRRFLFDKSTGEAYAEWINDDAVCLETGDVLFSSRNKNREYDPDEMHEYRRFDFSAPSFRRVDDPTIYTDELIEDGVLTMEDFAVNGASLTSERMRAWLSAKKLTSRVV